MDLRDRFTEMREMDLQVQSKSARLILFAAHFQCQTCHRLQRLYYLTLLLFID